MSIDVQGNVRRIVAGIAAAGIIATLGLVAAPAIAATSDSNDTAELGITSQMPAAPRASDSVIIGGHVFPASVSDDCAANPPIAIQWTEGIRSGFIDPVSSFKQITFTFSLGQLSAGTHTVFVTATGGCAGAGLTVSTDVVVRATYQTAVVSGRALHGDPTATADEDLTPVAGVTAELLDATGSADGIVVGDPATTDGDGQYSLVAPVDTQENADRQYNIRFTYPDGSVVFYGIDADVYVSSPYDWASATSGGPQNWSTAVSYDAIVTEAVPPPSASSTNSDRECPSGADSSTDDVETTTTRWLGVCGTDPVIRDVETIADDLAPGLDRFGSVILTTTAGNDYYVTGDTATTVGTTTTLQDDGIYLEDGGAPYSVTVVRTVEGSFARWVVTVKDSVGDVADVPFRFEGALASGGTTVWTGEDAARVSSDDGNGRSPILAHTVSAASYEWETDDGTPSLTVTSGELSYVLAAVDYSGCISDGVRESALAIATDAAAAFGTELAAIPGADCPTGWPDLPIVAAMRVGEPFDQTFSIPESEVWDWSDGGEAYAYDLPDGLEYEAIGEYEPGQSPQIRIAGTPTTAGGYDFVLGAWSSANGVQDEVELTGRVLDPAQQSTIILDAAPGDLVAGSDAEISADGLQAGTDYTITLRSTPQLLASGIVPAGLSVASTVTIPAGLPAGWHSITLHGTWYNGTVFNSILWFNLDASGRLLGTSMTAPAGSAGDLPVTGGGTIPIGPGAALLALGLLALGLDAVRRRARSR